MDFDLERTKAHAIKNLNYSNDSHEKLESMAEELDEKYDEIEELKQEIEKLKQENQKLKQPENNIVNKNITWGLLETKINYSWLWTTMTKKYDGNNKYDFEQDITNSENDNSISGEEYSICFNLKNQIECHINCGQHEEIKDDIDNAMSELAELYLKKDEGKTDKVNQDLDQIARWIRKSNEDYDDWSYDDEKEKLEVYVGNHTERYTRQELVECGVLYN